MLKPVEKPIKFVKNLLTKGKSYPITHVSAVIDDNGESVKSTLDSLKNKASVTKVTWLELKDKRDAGKLIPGALYRITDYQCTTTQEETQSAGHQFDIVLLALSEDKLAEEGWAMMHDNIYDVTFADGVTKKCYLYGENVNSLNIVDCNTLLGTSEVGKGELVINEDNKTITTHNYHSSDLNEENLPYNYFQHSNLSAWKVWYCLDNDKSRFAWADDSMGESSKKESIKVYISEEVIAPIGEYTLPAAKYQEGVPESIEIGEKTYYAWEAVGEVGGLTLSKTPKENDKLYYPDSPSSVVEIGYVISYQPENLVYNGRGVIYRLIDEFNNDLPCDFKNILVTFKDVEGYLITAINHIDDHQDYSMLGSIMDITVSLCLINDGIGNHKNAIPIGIIAPSLKYGEVIYNIKISSSALIDAGKLTNISSNTIIGYTM